MTYRNQSNQHRMQAMATMLDHRTPAAAIADLCERGWTMRGIAREFDVPFSALRWCAERHGITFPRRGAAGLPVDRMQVEATRGMKRADAARELGVSITTIVKWRKSCSLKQQ